MTIQANLHGRIGTIENKTWNNKQYTALVQKLKTYDM